MLVMLMIVNADEETEVQKGGDFLKQWHWLVAGLG